MPGGSAPECAPLPRPSYLAICAHNAVARPERLPAGIAVFHALHFALDICNMPSPLFTGVPAMLQNLPFMEQEFGDVSCAPPRRRTVMCCRRWWPRHRHPSPLVSRNCATSLWPFARFAQRCPAAVILGIDVVEMSRQMVAVADEAQEAIREYFRKGAAQVKGSAGLPLRGRGNNAH